MRVGIPLGITERAQFPRIPLEQTVSLSKMRPRRPLIFEWGHAGFVSLVLAWPAFLLIVLQEVAPLVLPRYSIYPIQRYLDLRIP